MTIERVREVATALEAELNRVVRGQETAVRDLVIAMITGGHVLLEGAPGLGKTLLVRTLARATRASFARIQFTPDLMPSDITGTAIFQQATGDFHFGPGPVFTQVLLADEINRTPPKTQAALLEAMQEGQVTLDGTTHALPRPFFVAATQNPVEYEGTYPLPEAQLDRFLMKIRVGYPDEESERAILDAHATSLEALPAGAAEATPVLDAAELGSLRDAVAGVFLEASVRDYITRIVRASRSHGRVFLGGSTRAAVSLSFAAKTAAACAGRQFVRPDDVKSVCPAVLRHRLVLRSEAEVEGIGVDQVVADLLGAVEVHDQPAASG